MILDKLISLLSEQFVVDIEKINGETSFRDDLNADSLDLVEMVMTLEDEFGIEIEDEDVENIKTVNDAVEYIKDITGEDN